MGGGKRKLTTDEALLEILHTPKARRYYNYDTLKSLWKRIADGKLSLDRKIEILESWGFKMVDQPLWARPEKVIPPAPKAQPDRDE